MADNIIINGDMSSNGVVIDVNVTTAGETINGELQTGGKGEQGLSIKGDKGDTGAGLPPGGTTGQVPVKLSATSYDIGWADSASGGGVTSLISKTAHGYIKGQLIAVNGSGLQLALADVPANAEVLGMVSQVLDANTFVLASGGKVTGLAGLTTGTVYYVSPVTPGNLTATEPTTVGQVSKPVFVADSATSGYFFNFRGYSVGTASMGGGGGGSGTYAIRAIGSSGAITSSDDTVVGITTGINITLPDATTCTQKPYRTINNTNGNISLVPAGSQTFEGSNSALVMAPGQTIIAIPYAGNWIS